MLLISSACIFLLTFIPYISAKDLGVLAQRNRLEHLAKALNLWDDKEHKVKEMEDIFKADYSEDIKNCEQLAECFNYLRITLGKEEAVWQFELYICNPGAKKERNLCPDNKYQPDSHSRRISLLLRAFEQHLLCTLHL